MRYSPFRHIDSIFWKRRPIHLTLFVTGRCNSKCPFCFYLSGEGGGRENIPELSLEEIKKISSSMGKLLWLAFSGGEIFLRNDIVEITKVFYAKNKPAVILFPTNGLLTDVIVEKIGTILDYCKKSAIVVKLSLDGPEDIHDSLRGVRGGFKRTLRTYYALSELLDKHQNFELGINTVFCSANEDYMEEIIELVKGLKNVRTHTISLIRGDVSEGSLKETDIGKYHRTIKKLEANLKKGSSAIYGFRGARLKAAQDILQRSLIMETATQKRALIPCYAGRLNLVVTETADVYPCETFKPDMKLGNLRDNEYNIKKVLKTEQAREILHSIKNNCYCTHECYFMTNILFNPSTYPALLREYLQLLNLKSAYAFLKN